MDLFKNSTLNNTAWLQWKAEATLQPDSEDIGIQRFKDPSSQIDMKPVVMK
jgi:hypothetical protein